MRRASSPKLQYIQLENNQVAKPTVSLLSNLRSLYLSNNQVESPGSTD
ncbi:MAG: hypothetical protein U0992_22630 [Planctomycetaceae bacterium]